MRYRADFNRVRKRRLSAIVGYGGSNDAPVPGALVQLFDGDGNTCYAEVERVEGQLVVTRPIWQTWRPAVRLQTDLMDALLVSVQAARVSSGRLPGDRVVGHETRGDDVEIFEVDAAI